jgi:UrcA family protein
MKIITVPGTHLITLVAVAGFCLASVTIGAHADQTANDVQARTVHYADLNLDTRAGSAVLYQRIRHAAEQVCGDAGSRQLEQARAAKACIDQAIQSSVRFVNTPKLTNEYNTHFGVAQKTVNLASVL